MEYKKSMIIIILAIFLVSITGVCASDANDTLVASEDNSQMELSPNNAIAEDNLQTDEDNAILAQANDDESLSAQTGSEILSASEGNYSDLRADIGNGGNLTKSYYRYHDGDGDTIEITTQGMVINGNGAVIDMGGSNIGALIVSASDVTIKNITFMNGKEWNAGAIYCEGENTKVYDCNFINNTAQGLGGAILIVPLNFEIFGCNFIDNHADANGGAIFLDKQAGDLSTSHIANCNFTNNTARVGGGAVYSNGAYTVTDCNFTGNSANTYDGGAVYFNANGTVTNCNLANNKADRYGGAIHFTGSASVINSTFTDNECGDDGGAIYMYNGAVTNCSFIDNKGTTKHTDEWSFGGAIYMYNGAVTNCNFDGNYAKRYGAIFYSEPSTADTCIFKTDSDTTNINYIHPPTLNVDNFTTAYGSGEKLTFDLRTNSGMYVGNGNISISVYNKNNDSWVGDYSCLSGEEWTVDLPVGSYYAIFTTEYAEFKPVNRTITINPPNHTFWALNQTINGNDKTEINLTNDYYFDPAYDEAFVKGIAINRKVTVNGNGHTIDAKSKSRIFYIEADHIIIKNLTFTNGFIGDEGASSAAIYLKGDYGSVANCSFRNNVAQNSGAVTMWGNNNSLSNCSFVNNSAISQTGAVHIVGDGFTVFNCSFENNTAGTNTGALFLWGASNGTVSDCSFINNTANTDCGTLNLLSTGNVHVSGCFFINNPASTYGFSIIAAGTDFHINNCVFLNNTAGRSVIYVSSAYNQAKHFTINNNIFLNNNATSIVFAKAEDTGNADCNWFGNNATDYDREPITTNTNMTTWLFLNATGYDDIIPLLGSTDIVFKLYSYNNITKEVSEYDSSLLMPVNLTVTSTRGQVDNDNVNIGGNVTYKATSIGKGSVTASIEDASYTIEFNIQTNSTVDVKSIVLVYGETAKIAATTEGATGITAKIDGKAATVKGNTIMIPVLDAGTHTLTVTTIPDEYHTEATKTVTITVSKVKTALTASAKAFKFEDKTKKYAVTLKDGKGRVMKNTKVTLKVNGVTYTATTNAKGVATFALKKLTKKGSFNAAISYAGDKNHIKIAKTVKITVKAPAFKTVSYGSKDKNTVKKIQVALKKNGFYLKAYGHYLKVDGIYHGYTVKAVKQFQKAKKLKVTGKVDYTTAKKLKII